MRSGASTARRCGPGSCSQRADRDLQHVVRVPARPPGRARTRIGSRSSLGCAAVGLLVAAVTRPCGARVRPRRSQAPARGRDRRCAVLVVPLYARGGGGSWVPCWWPTWSSGRPWALWWSRAPGRELPLAVRATGIALTYGLATALVGGTAPLVGSVLAQRGLAARHPGVPGRSRAAGGWRIRRALRGRLRGAGGAGVTRFG